MVSKPKGPLPPISCFVLGYRSSNVLKLGRKKTVYVGIKAICLFSKHGMRDALFLRYSSYSSALRPTSATRLPVKGRVLQIE